MFRLCFVAFASVLSLVKSLNFCVSRSVAFSEITTTKFNDSTWQPHELRANTMEVRVRAGIVLEPSNLVYDNIRPSRP